MWLSTRVFVVLIGTLPYQLGECSFNSSYSHISIMARASQAQTWSHEKCYKIPREARPSQPEIITPEPPEETTPIIISLGVTILFDKEYRANFENYDGEADVYLPLYLSCFLRAVELRFREVSYFAISLTLIDMHLIPKEAINYRDNSEGPGVRGSIINSWLKSYWQTKKLSGDVGIFLTGATEIFRSKELSEPRWPDNVERGKICTPESVFVAVDDGQTFRGVQQVATELSRLLGATEDTDASLETCRPQDLHLTSSRFGGYRPTLSSCSAKDMRKHLRDLMRTNHETCLLKPPAQPTSDTTPYQNQFPSDFIGAKHIDTCDKRLSTMDNWIHTCTENQDSKSCRIKCCVGSPDGPLHHTDVPQPDGKSCEEGKICIFGNCVPKIASPVGTTPELCVGVAESTADITKFCGSATIGDTVIGRFTNKPQSCKICCIEMIRNKPVLYTVKDFPRLTICSKGTGRR